MRLAPATTLVAAWLFTGVAGFAAPLGPAQYVGPVTGDPERDTYGYVGQVPPKKLSASSGPSTISAL
jgi:hypothetical protein